ncbi:MAG: YibE/F family protein [Lachnospiraceae bacterium]|nr:YibE/F family protein [Lachnospiraceae bacterium]
MKKHACTLAVLVLAVVFLAAAALFDWNSVNSYTSLNTSTMHYVRGVVTGIDAEDIEKDSADERLYLGSQELTVRILEGDLKGEEVAFTNYLTRIHSIFVTEGQRVIVCADTPENAEAYYTLYNYDRTFPLILLIAIFALAMLLVGRTKGLRALLGVVYSLLVVTLFLVQAIYHGFSPVGMTLLAVLVIAGVSLLLLNGFSRRTAAGFLSTLAGVAMTAVLFLIFSRLLHLSGYNTDEAETLLSASYSTGLSIRWLLLAGVLISGLGAVMDVAVSLAASLEELVLVHPNLERRKLVMSGFHIGKDMIGTMSNTLILAFAGTSLNTMLCLLAYGYQTNQLLSSNYLAVELSQGLCATLGVVLTVPVTTAVAALLFFPSRQQSSH